MSDEAETSHRPSFLSELTAESTLSTSLLRKPVTGPEDISRIIMTVGSMFSSIRPSEFRGTLGDKNYLDYDGELPDGQKIFATIVLTKGEGGKISNIEVGYSPLGGLLTISTKLKEMLSKEIDPSHFY